MSRVIIYHCIDCNYAEYVDSNDTTRDGLPCRKCGGRVVPKETVIGIDLANNEFEKANSKSPKLLVIELDSESSVPKVLYKGEDITRKTRIRFNWETKQSTEDSGCLNFNIEYIEQDSVGYTIQKGIGLNR